MFRRTKAAPVSIVWLPDYHWCECTIERDGEELVYDLTPSQVRRLTRKINKAIKEIENNG